MCIQPVDVIATAVLPHALSSTMASCSRVAMNASNKRSRKAKHSGKENFDAATDGDNIDDFMLLLAVNVTYANTQCIFFTA